MKALGDFIGGQFLQPTGDRLVSVNPARDGEPVFETYWTVDRVADAVAAAQQAQPEWSAKTLDERFEILCRFRDALAERVDTIADAIVLENGKIRSEALAEARSLASRFDGTLQHVRRDLVDGPVAGHPHEVQRFLPHGVVGVVGPYNFPLHLCNVHVAPALLLGNTVVMKPTSITPLCGQRYAEAAHAAGLPEGIFNLVQGRGAIGSALVGHSDVRALCFTGSYPTGLRIMTQALDRPELLLALEMGGKNAAVVLDDADVRQAAHEIVIGGYLSSGQRCTCTERVFVHRSLWNQLIPILQELVSSLRVGDPDDPSSFAGPLTTAGARESFETCIEAALAGGAEPLVPGGRLPGGYYAKPSLHALPDGKSAIEGYTDTELFGPDLSIQVFDDDDEAIALVNQSVYGLANSVFTRSRARYERFLLGTRAGILNWNRTTNKASPRLPFGGVGMSGNFRPAGSYAPRNVVIPVAIQENDFGVIEPHPMLAAALPGPDLDGLAQRHAEEEAQETKQNLLDTPRPMGVRLPEQGHLPLSEHYRSRLYAGERMAREKKPGVFDHLRSVGPWMVSVDEEPLAVLDGMSQTATQVAGFAPDAVVRGYFDGAFGDSLVRSPDSSWGSHGAIEAYADTLRAKMPELPHVSFTNSGAEANEKALALCRLHATRPEANRILAFQGSFHGRTLLALHATWNPKKRGPFEIPGYEVAFAPFPARSDDRTQEPSAPNGYLEAAAAGDIARLLSLPEVTSDALLAQEVEALQVADEHLQSGDIFVCMVEPMQSEGGDRYATARFYQALRLLTRHHQVSLIMDEVQTGYGLGGAFSWASDFGLVDKDGNPDVPDAMVWAKRAQVGVCTSRFPDPEPTSVQLASLVRGRIHAEILDDTDTAKKIQALVEPRLKDMATRYPQLVGDPRGQGFAFAFDLPSPDHMKAYLGQRFWRGAVVFGAGTRTVRYRLSNAYTEREIDKLFTMIRRSLSWLDANPGKQPPGWEDAVDSSRKDPGPYTIRTASSDEVDTLVPAIMALEERVFEPSRRDTAETLRKGFEDANGVAVVAESSDDGRLLGYALGAPLERFDHVEGPAEDPNLGQDNTMYSIAISVDPDMHGSGLGRALKGAQLRAARAVKGPNGPRYHYSTGRNRQGLAAAMTNVNRAYGAYVVKQLANQYENEGGEAIYYRIPLRAYAPPITDEPPAINLSDGISQPLATPPQSLLEAQSAGLLYGPAVSKVTICNYVTPAIVRAVEWVSALTPNHPHLYLTSSRDETFDKCLRVLRWNRKDAVVAVGLEGGYVGHTTGAARSFSDPSVHRQGPAHFDWPRLPHPAEVGSEATIAAFEELVQREGADRLLGLILEPLQERTGRCIPADFWLLLERFRATHNLPVVFVETASANYRTGAGPFAASSIPFVPDMITWWCGGHLGLIHVRAPLFVSTPLTMVSTWDGDELSLIRTHHTLRALRSYDHQASIERLNHALEPLREKGLKVEGQGLYRVVDLGTSATDIQTALAQESMQLRLFSHGPAVFAPSFDFSDAAAARLREILG